MTTVPILTTTLAIGPHTFGPTSIADNLTQAQLLIDRTVASGFNATPAAHASIEVHWSTDGGVTWQMLAAAGIDGGLINDKHGTPYTQSSVTVGLPPAAGRQVNALIVVSGSSVAVAGSLTVN